MSKRNNEGDVIANRMGLLEAKGQKLLASLYGSRPGWDSGDSAAALQDDDDQDLKQIYAHDRIGLGGVLPKDIEDGSFTRKLPTSDDKLLQQLIGKKKAKAHMTAKQEAARPNAATKAQKYAKPTVANKEESDDEDEGRAATFKSKRQRNREKQAPKVADSDDEDEETRAKRLAADAHVRKEKVKEQIQEEVIAHVAMAHQPSQKEEDEDAEAGQLAPKKAKAKPKSFLDEILAERSKKKAGKKGKA